MPTYEYQCAKCRQIFEIRQRISEPALTVHDGCGGPAHRLLSAAPFILKGEGWYVTDYPSEARKKAKESEKPTPAGETKPAASPDTKAETKPAAATNTETKAASVPASSPAKSSD